MDFDIERIPTSETLQQRLANSEDMIEIKEKIIQKLQKELEEAGETCKEIKKDRDNYLNQLLESRDKLYRSDYTVQNQKKIITDLNKVFEKLTKENRHLWGLVSLQVEQKHV